MAVEQPAPDTEEGQLITAVSNDESSMPARLLINMNVDPWGYFSMQCQGLA